MKKLPIAEIFDSPQGEGLYSGTLMTFIRIAGCSVGKKLTEADKKKFGSSLPVYTEKCTLYDGREFLCDTDFRAKAVMDVTEIVEQIPNDVAHVCITGGEPLNHDLTSLLYSIHNTGKLVHIETSGTVPITKGFPAFSESDLLSDDPGGWLWLTVSPKRGVLDEMLSIANEVKLLVDENFNPDNLPEGVKDHLMVYIQPVNFEHEINWVNMKMCLDWQKKYPHWRLSNQSHKSWGVR